MFNNTNNPIVYITGAGPGDPSLLTLKAKEAISNSEVIVYDTLVSSEILELIEELNPSVKMVFVGKTPYKCNKSVSQGKIHELLLELSKEHKTICRLKGGDPSVFGRVGEEGQFLFENGINFEIIPGISSVTAASSYSGIPLTHRDYSSAFTVITAHQDPDNSSIDWNSFDALNNTLVLMMGTRNLPKIASKLLDLGRDSTTPIAVIYKGTVPEQNTFTSTLGTINEDLQKVSIKPPSLIVIGDVVNCKKYLNWFENKPLFGKKVLVTRSKTDSRSLSKKLQLEGAKALSSPIVEYKINEKEIYNKKIISELSSYDWIVFPSKNSVKYFFEILKKNYLDSRALAGVKIATVGSKTKETLDDYNLISDFIPKKFTLESLVSELSEIENLKGKKILIPTQEGISRDLNLNIVEWVIYGAEFVEALDEKVIDSIKEGLDVITVFSSNTAKKLYDLLNENDIDCSGMKLAVIGDETASTVKDLFGKVDIVAEPFTEEGLINSLKKYYELQGAIA